MHGLGRILHFLGEDANTTPTERECVLGEYSWVVGAPFPDSITCPRCAVGVCTWYLIVCLHHCASLLRAVRYGPLPCIVLLRYNPVSTFLYSGVSRRGCTARRLLEGGWWERGATVSKLYCCDSATYWRCKLLDTTACPGCLCRVFCVRVSRASL